MSEQPTRLEQLRRMLAAREGKPGYKTNVAEIKDEIARLEKLSG